MPTMTHPAGGGVGRGPGEALTESVDVRAARITARGRLGLRGAELLAATVGQLRRSGARSVVLDLSLVATAEPAALAVLARVRREVAAAGGRLVLSGGPARDLPAEPAAGPGGDGDPAPGRVG